MKTYKLLFSGSFLFLALTACNSNQRNFNKNSPVATDSTPQSSRDSIAKVTTVTPSPSAIPTK